MTGNMSSSTSNKLSDAADTVSGILSYPFFETLKAVIQIGQSLTAMALGISAAILNAAILLTMHIKDFVAAAPGVLIVWTTIRDLSGMFIIFMLLYASFKIILGFDEKIGNLIKNIVIAGILINFSFFITGLAIDGSNLISLQLYNSIAPGSDNIGPSGCAITNLPCMTGSLMSDSHLDNGLTSVIMSKLSLQSLWKPSDLFGSSGIKLTNQVKAVVFSLISWVATWTTSISLLLAGICFIIRFFLLIFLLAFSPIWFASWVFPSLKESSKSITKLFWSQLVFMPVYLFLLYASLVILSASAKNMTAGAGALNVNSGATAFIGQLVTWIFVLFALNLPLVTAFAMGGAATKWVNLKKVSAGAIWKGAGAWAGRNTAGLAADRIKNSDTMKRIGQSSPEAYRLANRTLTKVTSASFGGKKGGYDTKIKDQITENEALYKQLGNVDASQYKTLAERKEAEKLAKERQQGFVGNLSERSAFNMFLSNKANQQSAYKLDPVVNAEQNAERLKELDAELGLYTLAADPIALKKLNDSIVDLKNQMLMATNQQEKIELQKSIDEGQHKQAKIAIITSKSSGDIQKDIEKITGERDEYADKVKRAAKAQQDEETKDILKKLKALDEPKKEEPAKTPPPTPPAPGPAPTT